MSGTESLHALGRTTNTVRVHKASRNGVVVFNDQPCFGTQVVEGGYIDG